jgi:nicotinic acetylcholine receptor
LCLQKKQKVVSLFTLLFKDFQCNPLQVDLRHINQRRGTNRIEMGMDLQEYYISTEWDIMTAPAVRNEKYYPCCEEPYPVRHWVGN